MTLLFTLLKAWFPHISGRDKGDHLPVTFLIFIVYWELKQDIEDLRRHSSLLETCSKINDEVAPFLHRSIRIHADILGPEIFPKNRYTKLIHEATFEMDIHSTPTSLAKGQRCLRSSIL